METKKVNKNAIRDGFRKLVSDKQYIDSIVKSGKNLDAVELKKRGIELVTYDIPNKGR
jgi:hypothetical protein